MRLATLLALLSLPVLSNAKPESIPSLVGKKIAVLAFGLDKSIVKENAERDGGPGLLQKSTDYYAANQAATDSLYAHFLASVPVLFEGMQFVPVDSIVHAPGYQTATACVPKKFMGREIFGCPNLNPTNGLNAASLTQAKENFDPFAKNLGLDYFLVFVSSANYRLNAGAGVNGLSGGAGKMRMETTVYLMQPGKGSVWSTSLREDSEHSGAMVGDLFSTDNYVLVGEAFTKMVPKLREGLAKGLTAP